MCLFGNRRKEKKSTQGKARSRTAGGEGDEPPSYGDADKYPKGSRYTEEATSISSLDAKEPRRDRDSSWEEQPRPSRGTTLQSQNQNKNRRGDQRGSSWVPDDDPLDDSQDDPGNASNGRNRKTTVRDSEDRPSGRVSGSERRATKAVGCQANCQGVPKDSRRRKDDSQGEAKPRSSRPKQQRGGQKPAEEEQPEGTCTLAGCPAEKLKRKRKRKRKPSYGQRSNGGRLTPSYPQPPPYGTPQAPPRGVLQCAYLPRGTRPVTNCAGVLF